MVTSNKQLDDDNGKPDDRHLKNRMPLQDGRNSEEEFYDCQDELDQSNVTCQEPDPTNLASKPSAPCLFPQGADLDEVTRAYVELPLHKEPNTRLAEYEEEILRLRRENEMKDKTIARQEKEIKQMRDDNTKARYEQLQELLNTEIKDHQDVRKQLKQQTVQKYTVSTQTSLQNLGQNVENIMDSSPIFNGVAKDSMQLMDDQGQVHLTLQEPKGAQDETGETQTAMPPGEVQTIWVFATIPEDSMPLIDDPGQVHLNLQEPKGVQDETGEINNAMLPGEVQTNSVVALIGKDRVNKKGMNELADDPMLTGSSTFLDDLSGNEEYIGKIVSSGSPLPDEIFADTSLEPLVYEDDAFFPNRLFTEGTPLRSDDSDPSVTLPKTPNAPAEMEVDYWVNEASRTDVRLGEQLRAGPDACAGATEAQDIHKSKEPSPSTSGTKRPAQDEPTPEKNKKQKQSAKQRDRPQKNWKWTPQLREEFLDAFMTARDVLTLQNKGTKPNEASVLRYIKRMDTGKKFPSDKILKSTFSNLVIKYQNHVTEKCKEYAKKCREYEQKEHWEYDMEKYQECVRLHQEYQRENSLKFEDIKASDASLKKIKDLLRADLLYGTKL